MNLGILAVLKYTNFAIANVNGIAALFTGRHSIARVNLVLPLGISFYTFQTMGYVIDVYRGKAEAEKIFLKWRCLRPFSAADTGTHQSFRRTVTDIVCAAPV